MHDALFLAPRPDVFGHLEPILVEHFDTLQQQERLLVGPLASVGRGGMLERLVIHPHETTRVHRTGESSARVTSHTDDVLAVLERVVPRPGTIDAADLARIGLFHARTGRGGRAVVDGLLCVLGGDGNGIMGGRVVDRFPKVEVGRVRWRSGSG